MNSLAIDKIVASWYEKATVRYTPRIIAPKSSDVDRLFPIARSAICNHPLVISRKGQIQNYILAQSAYQFLFGIGMLETKLVIQCALDIVHNKIAGVNAHEKIQAMSVLIDEGYHAYVAMDYIIQIQEACGFSPISEPETNCAIEATTSALEKIPNDMKDDFRLLAITLAENVMTDEIASMGRESDVEGSFIHLMKDHVRDEGRHANYFVTLMKKRWLGLPEKKQRGLCAVLPEYLDQFLDVDLGRSFERSVLSACKFSDEEVNKIIEDTNSDYFCGRKEFSYQTKSRLYRLLNNIGVLDLPENMEVFSGKAYAS